MADSSARIRARAAQSVAAVFSDGQSLREGINDRGIEEPKDRALLRQLVYGCLRHYDQLDGLLNPLLRKPLKQKDADIRALMLVGIYQLRELRTPDHAALATTVEATRVLKKPWATGLVNGVLRNYQRRSEQLESQLSPAQQASHPQWLYQAFQAAWPDQLAQILTVNNSQPPMTLRVNQQAIDRERYLEQLCAAGIEATPGKLANSALTLQKPMDVAQLPGFIEGLVSVQDESAQLAAPLLSPAAGERVLDACAAPGGKTCHLLEQQPDLLELVASDVDPQRLERVEENLERLGLQAQVVCADGQAPGEELAGEFDRILIDAPCSGSGVIRRHPDIKLLRRDSDIQELAAIQLQLLTSLWQRLKIGGQLLYVTCSILPQENAEVVRSFLQQSTDATIVPSTLPGAQDCEPGVQLLPEQNGGDGLYFCLLQKL